MEQENKDSARESSFRQPKVLNVVKVGDRQSPLSEYSVINGVEFRAEQVDGTKTVSAILNVNHPAAFVDHGLTMHVSGSVPGLGSWNKQNTLRMTMSASGDWEARFLQSAQSVQYRYMLKDHGGHILWTSPKVRSCSNELSVSRSATTRIVDAISSDETEQDWGI